MNKKLKQLLVNILVSLGIGLTLAALALSVVYLVCGVLDFLWHIAGGA